MNYSELIAQMTLEEKCGLLSGRDIWSSKPIERLDVPSIFLADGPSGLRKQVGAGDHLGLNASLPATCWPAAATVACSWDPALCEELGQALGAEAAAQGVDVVLGPGLNLQRSPLCGRNFEYLSEDPYLAGKLAAGYIRGIQRRGVAACPKHFAANNQELHRMTSDSVVDERTLRELYLTGFEIAVKEGRPKTIMTSYNRVNGVYANENEHLLQDILVKEWGFSGAVITDWGGSNDHVEGVRAGSHLEMPGTLGDSDRQLGEAVRSGRIPQELVDRRVDELLTVILAAPRRKPETFEEAAHHALAKKIAGQAVVLLKNEGSALPLEKGTRVAVIGDFAAAPRYQGAGSSLVNPTRVENTLEALANFPLEMVGYAQGFERGGARNEGLKAEAVALAKQADAALFYLGLPEVYEAEGLDRQHMCLPQNQVEALEAVAAACPRVVAVLAAGSPVETPWLGSCKALVYTGLCGQAGAAAALQVICGQLCPAGRLAQTWPLAWQDEPVSRYWPGAQRTAEYREGPYVGYRYFETAEKPVRFAFGYGLSYTRFEYSDLAVRENAVEFTLCNAGPVDGAEVPQVYVGLPGGRSFRPTKELKGFAKVFLKAGESRRVTVLLDDKAFRYYNALTGRWETEAGAYRVMVGASAADIRLEGTAEVAGSGAPCPYMPGQLPSYRAGRVEAVADEEFQQLLGRPLPAAAWEKGAPLGMNDALCQMCGARSGLARLVYRALTWRRDRSLRRGKPDLNILFIYNLPFRGIAKMMNGAVTMEMAQALLVMVNGEFFKGLGALARGFFASRRALRAGKTPQNHS